MIGFSWQSIACLVAFIITPIILMYSIYKMDIDYYEDGMSMIQATPNSAEQQELIREAHRKAYSKFKIRKTGINKGFGESTIFYKQLCEYRRTRPRIIGVGMITMLLILGGFALGSQGNILNQPIFYWGISAIILLFFSFNSTTLKAFSEEQFFSLPGKPILKILYSSVLGIMLALIDLLPAYLFVTIYSGFNIILVPLGLLLSGSVFLVTNSAQIIVFRIFGDVKSMFSLMVLGTLVFLVAAPAIGLIVASEFIAINTGATWGYFLMLGGFVLNCLFGLFGLFVGKKYLEQGPIR